ncbi:MAG TPA: hypothetical protein VJ044_17805, partial [Candidatus Hodarchaeales archaeon]|nr:hypothetical protein [Candidatus Hodarchaeales archaeon]
NSSHWVIQVQETLLFSKRGLDPPTGTPINIVDQRFFSDFMAIVAVESGVMEEIIPIQGESTMANRGTHFYLVTNVENDTLDNIRGIFVLDFFRPVTITQHNGSSLIKASQEFSGIEELVSFTVNLEAFFRADGILHGYNYSQIEQLVLVPELIYCILPFLIFAPIYYALEKKLRMGLVDRVQILLSSSVVAPNGSQSGSSFPLKTPTLPNSGVQEPNDQERMDSP